MVLRASYLTVYIEILYLLKYKIANYTSALAENFVCAIQRLTLVSQLAGVKVRRINATGAKTVADADETFLCYKYEGQF